MIVGDKSWRPWRTVTRKKFVFVNQNPNSNPDIIFNLSTRRNGDQIGSHFSSRRADLRRPRSFRRLLRSVFDVLADEINFVPLRKLLRLSAEGLSTLRHDILRWFCERKNRFRTDAGAAFRGEGKKGVNPERISNFGRLPRCLSFI